MDVLCQISHHIISSKYILLIAGIIALGSVYLTNNTSLYPSSLKDISLRNLNQIPNIKSNLLTHLFLKNITQYPYFGNWNKFLYENNRFDNLEGEAILYLSPNISHFNSSISSISYTQQYTITNNTSLLLIFYLKDGQYVDTFFKGNLTFDLPSMFNEILLSSMNDLKEFTLVNNNKTVALFSGEYFDETSNKTYDSCDITLTFYPQDKIFLSSNEHLSSNLYSKVHLYINNTEKQFELDIISMMEHTDRYPIGVLNYSIMLSLIGLIQIYYSTQTIMEINSNIQYGLNIDLMTVALQIIWGSILSAVHFFFALTHNDQSYEYGMPSFIHFCLFSVFQLKILFMAWKCRYNDLFANNIFLFRRQLFRFYMIFYIGLFLSLTSLKYWYHSFPVIFVQYAFTWIFQIIHSAYYSTKPPFSFSYILVFTLGKLFAPMYIKAYSANIFELKPSYCKVVLLTLTVLTEAIVLSLQKIMGPKFFIPKSLRAQGYNYYRDISEIKEIQNECIICLEKLELAPNPVTVEVNEFKDDDVSFKKSSYIAKIKKYLYNYNSIAKKEYMLTSCGHTFHSVCLEKWLEMKNECPYCRNKIPPLEY